ncbi:transforming growth factor beta-1-induced transcript 1 protein isoform b [Mus musculus]|uniref:transforming growth factor beta-1-induced transcript 1 protein isoform b n=1 Tax=Mus musculus TaxID=10090 RepID=UPI0003EAE4E3|nr:transforming growth factor beta-1-induced transcript 1 protein isoform b [Mus musculus]|eukprot:NP_001276480.1 transforming growth factor beta-1-induced transcript 1 protein isoform b [Mus musculus]
MEDLDALLSDLETTTSHMSRLGAPKERPPETLTPPPPYGHQPQTGSGESSGTTGDKDHLYSTVCKPRSPKPVAPVAPPFSSSSGVLGNGLCELDRLLQELNATQFNITDEIMSQFPSSKMAEGEEKEDQSEDKSSPTVPPSPFPAPSKPSATSATQELDRLMASLSDFRVQNHLPASGPPQPPAASPTREGCPSPPGQTSKGSLDTMLGLLQSDLSRRGVPTQAKGLCGSCNKPIAGWLQPWAEPGTRSTSFAAVVPQPWEAAASSRRMGLPFAPSATLSASPHDVASVTNPSDTKWLPPWAPTGTQNISAASAAESLLEKRVSTSGRVVRTAGGTSCSCSPHAARAAKALFWITTSRHSARSGTQTASCAGNALRPSPEAAFLSTRVALCVKTISMLSVVRCVPRVVSQ